MNTPIVSLHVPEGTPSLDVRVFVALAVEAYAKARGNRGTKWYESARLMLPYALQHRKDGRLLALNRRYQPLGCSPGAFVDYESDAWLPWTIPGNPLVVPEDGSDKTWLFNDGCIPWHSAEKARQYRSRLVVAFPGIAA